MVQYLKNLLSFGPGQRMIQTGDQVQKDHGASKNGHADDIQQVPFLLRPKNQKHRANDSQITAPIPWEMALSTSSPMLWRRAEPPGYATDSVMVRSSFIDFQIGLSCFLY